MNDYTKSSIINDLQILSFDAANDADLAAAYFFLSLVHSITIKTGYANPHLSLLDPQLKSEIDKYSVYLPFELSSVTQAQYDAIDELCTILKYENLFGQNYRFFFSAMSPYIVADWETLASLTASTNGSIVLTIAVLALILRQNDKLRNTHNVFSQFTSSEMFAMSDSTTNVNFKIDKTLYEACWRAIFCIPNYNYQVKINGTIKNAIDKYRVYYVPLHHLFIDYYTVKSSRLSKNVVNPWAYVNKYIRQIPVETGISVSETLFDLYAYPMRTEKPTDVIRAIFCPKSKSDTSFECSFLINEFKQNVYENTNVLIVNPSPDLLLLWAASTPENYAITSIFAVPDDSFAYLYRSQFPQYTFITFENIHTLSHINSCLITSRNLPIDQMEVLLSALDVCSENASIFTLVPNVLYEKNLYRILDKLQLNSFGIEKMIQFSSGFIQTKPCRKSLIHFRKYSVQPNTSIPSHFPTWYMLQRADNNYTLSKIHYSICTKDFYESGLSLKTLLSDAILYKKHGPSLTSGKRRDNPNEYLFSQEITLNYTIMANRKNRFAGQAYYCSTTTSENSTRKRGKRLTETIEKGLRAPSEAEVIQNLETIPFDDRVAPAIISDILEANNGCLRHTSLKTMWFCLRPQLLNNKQYRDEIAKELFCGEINSLSEIRPSEAPLDDYQVAFDFILDYDMNATQSLRYWKQLNIILQTAVSLGHLIFNPVSVQIEKLSNQATEEEREVRDALTKKTFTATEEAAMFAYICEDTNILHNGRALKRYEAQSLVLAAAIKFFTGLSTREVCALHWRDMVPVMNKSFYQFLITKTTDDKGNLIEYTAIGNLKKLRRVPIIQVLANMLLSRFNYLSETVPKNELKDHPIIVRSEKNISSPTPARPRYVKEKCQDVLNAANIPQHVLSLPGLETSKETDINHYFGDIFQSHFKYRARHTLGFTLGELCYIHGLEAPDTFSRHYCDYSSDLLQYRMSEKMLRWSETIPVFFKQFVKSRGAHDNTEILITPPAGETAAATLLLDCTTPTDIDLFVNCKHGYEFNVILYK